MLFQNAEDVSVDITASVYFEPRSTAALWPTQYRGKQGLGFYGAERQHHKLCSATSPDSELYFLVWRKLAIGLYSVV